MPKVSLITDTTDVLDQAQQLQQEHLKSNPYQGIVTAAGPTRTSTTTAPNWTYCKGIYKAATGKTPENAEQTIKTKDGKIDDTYGTINDACQVITMFHDIAQRVGKYLNNDNWINTGEHLRTDREPRLRYLLVAPRRQVLGRRQLALGVVRLEHQAERQLAADHAGPGHQRRLTTTRRQSARQ